VSLFGKRIDGPGGRRGSVRRQVGTLGTVVTIKGSTSVFVEDLCPEGARLLGRHLPEPGTEVLLRTAELAVLGRISWANDDRRGIVFEEGEKPSAGLCLGLQLRGAA
jgi:hypothetical protein